MLDLSGLSAWEIHFKSWIRDKPRSPSPVLNSLLGRAFWLG
jgi:hypothetical protein